MEKNLLALNYTTEVCFTCHQIANSLRKIFEDSPKAQIKNTSILMQKLLDLRQKALEEGEKWAKTDENLVKTTKKVKKLGKK